MAFFLNIDTAVETASVCLSQDAEVIKLAVNENKKDHAAWLHNTIQVLIKNAGIPLTSIEAIAVSIGPGSYTGLRIGLSAAKGLCYGLNIPLIAIGTLEMMAHSVKNESIELICPLIDARRMEVFTAVYNKSLETIIKPFATIIDKNSFADILSSHRVIFCGNGIDKLQTVLTHTNATFSRNIATAANLPDFAYDHFIQKKFADIAYIEPLYIKEFYSPAR